VGKKENAKEHLDDEDTYIGQQGMDLKGIGPIWFWRVTIGRLLWTW
jgi:hypothetical protein